MEKNTDLKYENISEDEALGEIASDKIFEDNPELAKELAEDRKIQEKAQQYKEMQEARKKQKRKKVIILLIVFLVIVLGVVLGIKIYRDKKEKAQNLNEVSITDNQYLIYGKVTATAGNNITITKMEEASDNTQEKPGDFSPENKQSSKSNARQSPNSGDKKSPNTKSNNTSSLVTTNEESSLQIPVGTEVVTKLGTIATFTSISNGDVLAIALNKTSNEIDKVWIVE